MKKLFLLTLLFAAGLSPVLAQNVGDLGIGAIIGDPFGPTAKYWVRDNQAIDAGMGFGSDFKIYADYLWHSYDVFPQPTMGKLGGYLGAGPRLVFAHDNEFGVRMVAGVSYWLPRHPVELFFEVAPVFQFSPDSGTDLDGGIGIRAYFSTGHEASYSSRTQSEPAAKPKPRSSTTTKKKMK